MDWKDPAWLWAQILSLLVLCIVLFAQNWRLRRLKLFGDSRVLGVSAGSIWGVVRALLLALGIACVAAILAGPRIRRRDKPPEACPIDIVLDFRSGQEAGSEVEQPWEEFCDTVDSLIALAPSSRFSVLGPGDLAQSLISRTADTEGLMLVLNASLPRYPGVAAEDFQRQVAASLKGKTVDPARKVVVISSRTRDELLRLWLSLSPPTPHFIRLSPGTNTAEFGIAGDSGTYTWSGQPEALRRLLQGEEGGAPRRLPFPDRFSATQLFALAGLILLLAEFAGPLVAALCAVRRGVD